MVFIRRAIVVLCGFIDRVFIADDLEKGFLVANHAKIAARPFLDGVPALSEIAHFRFQRGVALFQFNVTR